MSENLRLHNERRGDVEVCFRPSLDLVAEEARDEDDLPGIDRQHAVEHVAEHGPARHADEGLGLRPGLRPQACTKAGDGKNDVHGSLQGARRLRGDPPPNARSVSWDCTKSWP